MKKSELRKLIKEEIHNHYDNYLPSNLQNNTHAHEIMGLIIKLIEKINDPDIDQLEGGLADQMREKAIHMLKSNI